MKIMDGIKLGIGLYIGNSLIRAVDETIGDILDNREFESEFMNVVKDLIKRPKKPKRKEVTYRKVEVKGFRAD